MQTQNIKLTTADLDKLITDVCAMLGPEWKVKRFDPAEWGQRRPELEHTEGYGVGIEPARQPGKIHIYGTNWPMTVNEMDQPEMVTPWEESDRNTDIHVLAARGYVVLHSEITRRFLPEFIRVWKQCKERAEAQSLVRAGAYDTFRRLCEQMRVPVKRDYSGRLKISVSKLEAVYSYGDVIVNAPDSVEFHLRGMPAHVAVKLASFLGSLKGGK